MQCGCEAISFTLDEREPLNDSRTRILIYLDDTQLIETSSTAPFRFVSRILSLATCVLAILFFNTTSPFTDTTSLLFFASLIHSMDDGALSVSVQKELNAFSFNGLGAHQGASKTPYALSSKVVPEMAGAQRPFLVKVSWGTLTTTAITYSIKVEVTSNISV